jgi:hypothetical protein
MDFPFLPKKEQTQENYSKLNEKVETELDKLILLKRRNEVKIDEPNEINIHIDHLAEYRHPFADLKPIDFNKSCDTCEYREVCTQYKMKLLGILYTDTKTVKNKVPDYKHTPPPPPPPVDLSKLTYEDVERDFYEAENIPMDKDFRKNYFNKYGYYLENWGKDFLQDDLVRAFLFLIPSSKMELSFIIMNQHGNKRKIER